MDLNPLVFWWSIFWASLLASPTFCWGWEGGGCASKHIFKTGRGLTGSQFSRGGLLEKRGVTFFKGCSFFIEIKLKSEIFNNKNNLLTKMFCSMCSIITKNLINFKRWLHIPKWLISQRTLWLVPLKPSLCHNTRDIYFIRLLDY